MSGTLRSSPCRRRLDWHPGGGAIGLTTLTEVCDIVSAVSAVVGIPVVMDADTGFGNPVNVTRTVRLLEKAGAAGIQIKDQAFPKHCGHFFDKEVIPLEEMLQKLRAALDSRRDGDQIIPRTDAYVALGFEAALERAAAFAETGAGIGEARLHRAEPPPLNSHHRLPSSWPSASR